MTLNKGALFDPVLVTDLFNKVKGESSLAKLSRQEPIPFNGQKEFVFTMDNEIDVVAESSKKSHGGISLEPIIIQPIKVEYGARVSNEFMIASEEERINMLRAFNDGFAEQLARGRYLMASHGFTPRTGAATSVIGNKHFDGQVAQTIASDLTEPVKDLETEIATIRATDNEV